MIAFPHVRRPVGSTNATPLPYRRAFTLIELLVTISIIALLVVILLPALKKARESARQIVCASNMRSVGQLCMMYAGDNAGEYLPESFVSKLNGAAPYPVRYRAFGTGNSGQLGPALYGYYVTTGEVFYCPSGGDPKLTYEGTMGWDSPSGLQRLKQYVAAYNSRPPGSGSISHGGLYTNYYYNAAAENRFSDDGYGRLRMIHDGREAIMAEFIANVDETIGGIRPNHRVFECNVLFLDGHAEWYVDPRAATHRDIFPSYPTWAGLVVP